MANGLGWQMACGKPPAGGGFCGDWAMNIEGRVTAILMLLSALHSHLSFLKSHTLYFFWLKVIFFLSYRLVFLFFQILSNNFFLKFLFYF